MKTYLVQHLNNFIKLSKENLELIHTPPSGNYSGPSGGDVLTLVSENKTSSPNYTDSYIIADNGATQYVITIEDPDLLEVFYSSNSGGSGDIFDSSGNWSNNNSGHFPQGTDLLETYTNARLALKAENGLSDSDAYDHAMALVLSELGIAVLKKDNGRSDFHQLSTDTTEDGSNTTVYLPTKCDQ